jgi:hypothetical protein
MTAIERALPQYTPSLLNRCSVLPTVFCFQVSIKLLLKRLLELLANGPVAGALRLERNSRASGTGRFHRDIAKPLGNADGRILHRHLALGCGFAEFALFSYRMKDSPVSVLRRDRCSQSRHAGVCRTPSPARRSSLLPLQPQNAPRDAQQTLPRPIAAGRRQDAGGNRQSAPSP